LKHFGDSSRSFGDGYHVAFAPKGGCRLKLFL